MTSLSVFGNRSDLSRPLLVAIPPEQVDALISAIVELAQDGGIRSQDGKFSIFDLIERVAGKGGQREAWKRFGVQHPEVVAKTQMMQFFGSGQRPTPVSDIAGCVEILSQLPNGMGLRLKPDSLYCIQCTKTKVVKIGISNNPSKRLKALQTAYPFKLKIFWQSQIENAPSVEKSLHQQLKEYQLYGEWFKKEVTDLVDWDSLTKVKSLD